MLRLANGSIYQGQPLGPEAAFPCRGEVVFFTGMTGYVEALTDPSYAGQILVFSFPMLGNYGWNPDHMESRQVQVSGVIMRSYHDHHTSSLVDALASSGIPVLTGVDTRRLVLELREARTMPGMMVATGDDSDTAIPPLDEAWMKMVVGRVSCLSPYKVGPPALSPSLLLVDLGVKASQISCLMEAGFKSIQVVPWYTDLVQALEDFPTIQAVFLTNGPGDPQDLEDRTVTQVRRLMESRPRFPIFGICLGHQVLALAAGATTYKLPYGNRGVNIPVAFSQNKMRAYITSQNHGYAVDEASLPASWQPLFTNLNDGSNEGIVASHGRWFSVQFHPEARAGPRDTKFLFDIFYKLVNEDGSSFFDLTSHLISQPIQGPLASGPRRYKVLVLGSGGLSIGQAGEFDYSGSQALKAYKTYGLTTIVVNPNIATVQTTTEGGIADKVYSVPITPKWVSQIVEMERPDYVAVSFGGQTALNCAVALTDVFERFGVKVLGTPLEAIVVTEDREKFNALVEAQGASCAPSATLEDKDLLHAKAKDLGYPVLVRSGFALGGLGSGFASGPEELDSLLEAAPPGPITLDKSLKGWIEVEFEIVRDGLGNSITVCSMENFDPVGVHTGESIVVAPCLTLDDVTIQRLRSLALVMAKAIGIVGECNIQYALNPECLDEVYVIEVNARLSRSSALASKATGYPLAYVAALIGLGHPLPSLKNLVTGTTSAMFEPSLDYCTVKMPRWDLDKFEHVDGRIGTAMKSVGEVMAIGATFEEAIMKALRMVDDDGHAGLFPASCHEDSDPGPGQIQALMGHLGRGRTPMELHDATAISPYFLLALGRIDEMAKRIRSASGDLLETPKLLMAAKRLGFSDGQLARLATVTEARVIEARRTSNIWPSIFQIDTVAGEFACQTSYRYLTYHASSSSSSSSHLKASILVLGSGTYRIGSSVEFDWCAVNCVREVRQAVKDRDTIMLNYNPETVSTDFDEADHLIFDEISLETVGALHHLWPIDGVVVSVGGQTPNTLALPLHRQGYKVIGTHPEMIDMAENRFKFSRLLESLGVDQPRWCQLTERQDALDFASKVSFPVLVRPSYVLSGAAMRVVFGPEELDHVLREASRVSKDAPVVISKFIIDAKEIEVDAVAKDGILIHLAISEHIENAGVHSGDATLVLPPHDLTPTTLAKIEASTRAIAKGLAISGPFNIQFIAKDDAIKVIECNLRSSRSFPFVSKSLGINLIREATRAMLGLSLAPPVDPETLTKVGVKVPVFSFKRLPGADCVLGVEMRSTGEVACFGPSFGCAYLKALEASGTAPPIHQLSDFTDGPPTILLSIGSHACKTEMLSTVRLLKNRGYILAATPGTSVFYSQALGEGAVHRIGWPALDSFLDKCSFVLNVSMLDRGKMTETVLSQGYHLRRLCIRKGIPLLTDVKACKAFGAALCSTPLPNLDPSYDAQSVLKTLGLPGLIDVHVHIREPGDTYKGDWETETLAALAGGVTTVFVMPNTKPAISTPAALDLIVEAASAKAHCDWGIFIGGAADNQAEVLEMLNGPHASLIVGMKLYLDETYSGPLDLGGSWAAVHDHFAQWEAEAIAKPIVVHTEADNFLRVLGLMHLYPSVRVHVAHVHSRRLLDLVKRGKAQGLPLTCEATPHHLFAEAPIGGRGVKPPICGDAAYLRANLDTIDCFATDHAPHLASEAGCPGYPGLETAVGLLMAFGPETLKAKMHDAPRRIFGLGSGEETTRLRMAPDEEWTYEPEQGYSRCGWSPFGGRLLTGKVTRVELRGELVMMDGKIFREKGPMGRPVKVTYDSKTVSLKEESVKPVENLHREPRELTSTDDETNKATATIASLGFSSVLSCRQFTKATLRSLFDRATVLRGLDRRGALPKSLAGKTVSLLFMEPSTRTAASFQAATTKLGGSTIPISPSTSSLTKGESLTDTLRCVALYSDAIVLRGPTGCIAEAKPLIEDGILPCLISGGDGTLEHPTQGLLDVYTIREELGSLHGLTITIVGDLRHGRTIPSLLFLMGLYRVAQVHCVAPPHLNLSESFASKLKAQGLPLVMHTVASLEDLMPTTDVLYMTRLQKERLEEMADSSCVCRLTPEVLAKAKPQMIVMHPLPRVDEISTEVDSDPRAVYFRQMEHGLYLRMALLESLLLGSVSR